MKDLNDNEIIRLFIINAKITSDELYNLFEFEGADREKYFESLEKKYGKREISEKKD